MNEQIGWTQYMNMTAAQTKRLFAMVKKLVAMTEQGKRGSDSYKVMLNALKSDFPQDAQDFIEYYNL